MSDPKVSVHFRPYNSDKSYECDATTRDKWTDAEKQEFAKSGRPVPPRASFNCPSGPYFTLQEHPTTPGQFQLIDENGQVFASRYWTPSLTGDSAGSFVGDMNEIAAGARVHVLLSTNAQGELDSAALERSRVLGTLSSARRTYYKAQRAKEPGAKSIKPTLIRRSIAHAIRVGIGPYIAFGEERSTRLRDSFGNVVNDRDFPFTGGGVRGALYLNVCPMTRPSVSRTFNDKGEETTPWILKNMWLCGGIMGFLDPSLEFTTATLTGGSSESHDSSAPAEVSRTDGGLYLGIGTSLRHMNMLFDGANTPYFDAWLRFRTPFLAGSTFTGTNYAAKGSAQPFNFELENGLMAPFTNWTMEVGAAFDVARHLRLGLEVSLHPDAMGMAHTTRSEDGFAFAMGGFSIMARADFLGWWTHQELEDREFIDDRVSAKRGMHSTIPTPHIAPVPPPPPPARPAPVLRPPAQPPARPPAQPAPPPPPAAPLQPVSLGIRPNLEERISVYFKNGESVAHGEGRIKMRAGVNKAIKYVEGLIANGFDPNKPMYIIVEGYTSTPGTESGNLRLSVGRASVGRKGVLGGLVRAQRKGRVVPYNIIALDTGFGRTQPVGDDGKPISQSGLPENETLSRRTDIIITTSRAVYEQALARKQGMEGTSEPTPTQDRKQGEAIVKALDKIIDSGRRNRTGLTKVFFSPNKNTLYLVANSPYKNSSDTKSPKARQLARNILNRALRLRHVRKLLKDTSRNFNIELILHGAHVAANEDIANQRTALISRDLHKFGLWPGRGGRSIEEIPLTIAPAELSKHMESKALASAAPVDPIPGALDAIIQSVAPLSVDKVSTLLYRLPKTNPAWQFDAQGHASAPLLSTLAKFATQQGTAAGQIHVDLRLPQGSVSDPAKTVQLIAQYMQEYVPNHTTITASWSDGEPAGLFLAVGKQQFDSGETLREALHQALNP